jgi:hypothetical protein
MFEKIKEKLLQGDINGVLTSVMASLGASMTQDVSQLIYTLIFLISSLVSLWQMLKRNKHQALVDALKLEREKLELEALKNKMLDSQNEKEE